MDEKTEPAAQRAVAALAKALLREVNRLAAEQAAERSRAYSLRELVALGWSRRLLTTAIAQGRLRALRAGHGGQTSAWLVRAVELDRWARQEERRASAPSRALDQLKI